MQALQEIRLPIGGEQRRGRLVPPPVVDPLDVDGVSAAAAGHSRVVLQGGEPTLREDLLALIAAAKPAYVTLETDGLALTRPELVAPLREAGLDAVRTRLAAVRPEAHDHAVAVSGAGRRVVRAIRTCAAAGLEVAVDVLITRSGLPLLAETVAALARLGAQTVRLRPVTPGEVAADDVVALVPRLALLGGPLAAAVREGLRAGVRVGISGVPRCMLPESLHRQSDAAGGGDLRCAACPEGCPGVSPSYTGVFGCAELRTDDPADRIWLHVGVSEPSRDVRIRMLRAARRRPRLLRLVAGEALQRSDAPELLRELARLDVDATEVCGDVAPMAGWSDDELFRMKRIGTVHAALLGPDGERHDARLGRDGAFAASLAVLERLAAQRTETAAYAIVHEPEEVAGWFEAWADLPGPPAFRLAAAGGELEALAAAIATLPTGPVRAGLSGLLPACLTEDAVEGQPPSGGWSDDGPALGGAPPSSIDRLGTWEPCPKAARCERAARCPGIASGWTLEGVA